MGKSIKNPVILHVKYHLDGGGHIENATSEYGVTCEHNIASRDDLEPIFSPSQENDLKDILNEALVPQINTKEGIGDDD